MQRAWCRQALVAAAERRGLARGGAAAAVQGLAAAQQRRQAAFTTDTALAQLAGAAGTLRGVQGRRRRRRREARIEATAKSPANPAAAGAHSGAAAPCSGTEGVPERSCAKPGDQSPTGVRTLTSWAPPRGTRAGGAGRPRRSPIGRGGALKNCGARPKIKINYWRSTALPLFVFHLFSCRAPSHRLRRRLPHDASGAGRSKPCGHRFKRNVPRSCRRWCSPRSEPPRRGGGRT